MGLPVCYFNCLSLGDDPHAQPCPIPDELVTHPAFADYQLRVTDPHLCDPAVKQHSGYLDISDGKHLFFWYVSLLSEVVSHLTFGVHSLGSLNPALIQRRRLLRCGSMAVPAAAPSPASCSSLVLAASQRKDKMLHIIITAGTPTPT